MDELEGPERLLPDFYEVLLVFRDRFEYLIDEFIIVISQLVASLNLADVVSVLQQLVEPILFVLLDFDFPNILPVWIDPDPEDRAVAVLLLEETSGPSLWILLVLVVKEETESPLAVIFVLLEVLLGLGPDRGVALVGWAPLSMNAQLHWLSQT